MINKLNKLRNEQSQKGFTIIEVMIVLAIAGLIILIVLLAVPALQRNGRNTAIKNDGSALVAGISEFASNNDGAQPLVANSDFGVTTPGVIIFNNATGTPSNVKVQSSTKVQSQATGTVASQTPAAGTITVTFGTKCPATVSGASTGALTANARSSTVVYAIESAGALSAKCIDS
jgi:prepilin-type N-terminal cleavage/methylation domain-containing protein